jgi:hypothetical protein
MLGIVSVGVLSAWTMRHEFKEMVLTYTQEQRDAWNNADARGKRTLIPAFHEVHPMIVNQPKYHFGEFFTMGHFHAADGWLGFRFFVLAFLDDFNNPRYAPGGEQIRKLFPRDKLNAYVKARGEGRTDAGDPDLFLYKPNGEAMFLEVKVASDKIDKNGVQLQALAQIRSILGCRAEIVHLAKQGQDYRPRTYWVDMAPSGIFPLAHGW